MAVENFRVCLNTFLINFFFKGNATSPSFFIYLFVCVFMYLLIFYKKFIYFYFLLFYEFIYIMDLPMTQFLLNTGY